VDAAYGLQATWDMYKNVFGRNGINGLGTPTYARVHYDSAYDNAFYSDQCMCITYGDEPNFRHSPPWMLPPRILHGVCMTSLASFTIRNPRSERSQFRHHGCHGRVLYAGSQWQGSVIPDTGGTWTQGEQITTPAYPLKMRFLYKPSKDGKSADAWSPTLQNLNVHYSSGR